MPANWPHRNKSGQSIITKRRVPNFELAKKKLQETALDFLQRDDNSRAMPRKEDAKKMAPGVKAKKNLNRLPS